MFEEKEPSMHKLVLHITKHWLMENTGFFETVMDQVAAEVAPLIAVQVKGCMDGFFNPDEFRKRYKKLLQALYDADNYIDEVNHSVRGSMMQPHVLGLQHLLRTAIAEATGMQAPAPPEGMAKPGDIPF